MADLKQTSLYPLYEKYGAKTIQFGGWDMPVQFSGIKNEHKAVREEAGVFDVSHMGEVEVTGEKSMSFLNKMLTNDISKIQSGFAQYNIMCYESGGTVDDLLVYKRNNENFLLVVNASNTKKDFEWLFKHAKEGVHIENVSEEYGQLAVQGPLAENKLQTLTKTNLADIPYFGFDENVDIAGVKALVSRTGYTGEDGFEIYTRPEKASIIFEKLIEKGVPPIGLGARDTLRFEAKLALYGQEITEDITPLEAGLSFAVKFNKEVDFIGKEALLKQKEEGIPRKLVGIELIARGIPRHGYPVYKDGKKIGFITSGTQSPTLGKNVGLALIDKEHSEMGTEIEVYVRNKMLKAVVVKTPFYKR